MTYVGWKTYAIKGIFANKNGTFWRLAEENNPKYKTTMARVFTGGKELSIEVAGNVYDRKYAAHWAGRIDCRQ